jgi:hypothetical protein
MKLIGAIYMTVCGSKVYIGGCCGRSIVLQKLYRCDGRVHVCDYDYNCRNQGNVNRKRE